MTLHANNAEGGTGGTTVTSGNSGGASGRAFDWVQPDGGSAGTVKYQADAAAHGSLGYEFVCLSTGPNRIAWTNLSTRRIKARAYVQTDTAFPNTEVWVLWADNTAVAGSNFIVRGKNVGGNSRWLITNGESPSNVIYTGTVDVPTATIARVEVWADIDAGKLSFGWYLGDSVTPQEYVDLTGQTLNAGNDLTTVSFGKGNNGDFAGTLRMDDMAVDDVGGTTPSFIGPVVPPVVDERIQWVTGLTMSG